MTGLSTLTIVLPAVFLAGLFDAVAGGGGIISVPAYLAAGLPPHFAVATNKFSATLGTFSATARFLKKGVVDWKTVRWAVISTMIGAWIGGRLLLLTEPGFLRYLLLFLIPVIAVFFLSRKQLGMSDHSHGHPLSRRVGLTSATAFLIGAYDGFFGPGTGTFHILFFTAFLHYDFLRANGNTKVLNGASNLASLMVFILAGKILWPIALPAAAAGIAGNLVGARLAIRGGNRLVRGMFLTVLIALLAKIAWDLIRA